MPNDANDAQRMPNDAPSDSIFIFARKPVHTHTPFPRQYSERISGFTDQNIVCTMLRLSKR